MGHGKKATDSLPCIQMTSYRCRHAHTCVTLHQLHHGGREGEIQKGRGREREKMERQKIERYLTGCGQEPCSVEIAASDDICLVLRDDLLSRYLVSIRRLATEEVCRGGGL